LAPTKTHDFNVPRRIEGPGENCRGFRLGGFCCASDSGWRLRRRRAALVLLDTGWSRRQAAHAPLLDASTQQCNSRSLADLGQGVAQRRAGDAHQAQVGVRPCSFAGQNEAAFWRGNAGVYSPKRWSTTSRRRGARRCSNR
jgi:hypothetical protein